MVYQRKAGRAIDVLKEPGRPLSPENVSKAEDAIQWAYRKMIEEKLKGPIEDAIIEDLEALAKENEELRARMTALDGEGPFENFVVVGIDWTSYDEPGRVTGAVRYMLQCQHCKQNMLHGPRLGEKFRCGSCCPAPIYEVVSVVPFRTKLAEDQG